MTLLFGDIIIHGLEHSLVSHFFNDAYNANFLA